MLKDELEFFLKNKAKNLYSDFMENFNEDILQDDIALAFKDEWDIDRFYTNIVNDPRLKKIIKEWFEPLTWQEILKAEKNSNFEYHSLFASESRTNCPETYQEYLEGNTDEKTTVLCYAHDIGNSEVKTKLELAFPLLFSKKEGDK